MVGSLNFQPFQGFISVNYHRQAGSLNFRPVRGFIFVKHHRLGGSIYFQPACDILKNETLDRSEVCVSFLNVFNIIHKSMSKLEWVIIIYYYAMINDYWKWM